MYFTGLYQNIRITRSHICCFRSHALTQSVVTDKHWKDMRVLLLLNIALAYNCICLVITARHPSLKCFVLFMTGGGFENGPCVLIGLSEKVAWLPLTGLALSRVQQQPASNYPIHHTHWGRLRSSIYAA